MLIIFLIFFSKSVSDKSGPILFAGNTGFIIANRNETKFKFNTEIFTEINRWLHSKIHGSYIQSKNRAIWIGQILCSSWILKHVIEGKIEGRMEMTGRQGRRRKQLLTTVRKREDTGNWRGNFRSHSLDNLLWKRLWASHKTLQKNEWMNELIN